MSSIATHDCIPNTRGLCDACGRSLALRCDGDHPKRPGRRCDKLLAEVIVQPYRLTCGRCGKVHSAIAQGVLR